MTVIAAAFDDDGAYIGSDTQLSGQSRVTIVTKLRKMGGWMVGFAGAPVWAQFKPGRFKTPEDFADAWWEWAGARGHGDGGSSHRTLEGEALMVRRGEIVCISSDAAVVRPATHYLAIGSGEEVAMGALALASEIGLPAEMAVRLAVTVAIRHAVGCGGEPQVVRCR